MDEKSALYNEAVNDLTTFHYKNCLQYKKILDLLGREVKVLYDGFNTRGYYEINWDGTNNNGVTVSAGMYLYKINTENYVETKKMLLVK